MISFKKTFLIFFIFILIFPLSAFSSRKKVKEIELTPQEIEELQAHEEEKSAQEIAEMERLEAERLEAEKLEAERLENERLEIEKIEKERQEQLQKEKEEAERLEAERLEAERLEKERLEAEQKEAERIENEKKLAEVAANRYKKEYLSDYIVPDVPDILEEDETEYEPIINPNETDAFGCTLLMRAAKTGNEWQLKRLLESGADVNLKDNDGWTALMYAVRYNENLECTELLIEAGASIKDKNNYGSSALILAACYNNNPNVLTQLLKPYKSSDIEILKALVFMLSEQSISEASLISRVKTFVDMDVPLNSLIEGKTPLMYAAQYGNSNKILKVLMENGASATIRSTEGKTAFDYAEKNQKIIHDDAYWALNIN